MLKIVIDLAPDTEDEDAAAELERIAKLIREGFTSGAIAGAEAGRGWWDASDATPSGSLFAGRFERPRDAVARVQELTRTQHPERFDDAAREVNEIAGQLGDLIRGMGSACDAVVGALHIHDQAPRPNNALTLKEIRETMDRLYEQYPEALGA